MHIFQFSILDPKITVSALEIGIKAIQIGKIFACGAQI